MKDKKEVPSVLKLVENKEDNGCITNTDNVILNKDYPKLGLKKGRNNLTEFLDKLIKLI